MKFPLSGFGSLLLAASLFLPSCKDASEGKVIHQEISEKETIEALQKAFVDSSGEALAETPPGIDDFFTRLSEVSRSDTPIDSDLFISTDAIVSSMKSSGELNNLSSKQLRTLGAAINQAKPKLGASLQQIGFDAHKVQLVEQVNDKQLLVYVRLYDNDLNVVTQMRWWFIKTGEGWRSYDYEDLTVGLRSITLMARIINLSTSKPSPPWINAFIPLAKVLESLSDNSVESYEKLRGPLENLRKHKLPSDIESFASATMVSVHLGTEEYDAALNELQAARKGGYAPPFWNYLMGSTLFSLDRHDEALAAFETHMTKFGRDCDTLELVSDTYLGLEQLDQARAAAIEGLRDNPSSTNCVICLAAASSPAQIQSSEFLSFLNATPNPEETFECTLDYLIDLELDERADAVLRLFKKEIPESELLPYYEDDPEAPE